MYSLVEKPTDDNLYRQQYKRPETVGCLGTVQNLYEDNGATMKRRPYFENSTGLGLVGS